jgi:hypothetical protein
MTNQKQLLLKGFLHVAQPANTQDANPEVELAARNEAAGLVRDYLSRALALDRGEDVADCDISLAKNYLSAFTETALETT